jgi:hypothetical protein
MAQQGDGEIGCETATLAEERERVASDVAKRRGVWLRRRQQAESGVAERETVEQEKVQRENERTKKKS